MAKNFKELQAKMSPERRARSEAAAAKMIDEASGPGGQVPDRNSRPSNTLPGPRVPIRIQKDAGLGG